MEITWGISWLWVTFCGTAVYPAAHVGMPVNMFPLVGGSAGLKRFHRYCLHRLINHHIMWPTHTMLHVDIHLQSVKQNMAWKMPINAIFQVRVSPIEYHRLKGFLEQQDKTLQPKNVFDAWLFICHHKNCCIFLVHSVIYVAYISPAGATVSLYMKEESGLIHLGLCHSLPESIHWHLCVH